MSSTSIIVPTRDRPEYLDVALASIAPEARAAGAQLLVIDDAGPSARVRELAERHGALYVAHPGPLGLNSARNTGIERSDGGLLVFVDDDIRACPGWLEGLLTAASDEPQVDVFAGRIVARLEGPGPHSCGAESAPITTLELGPRDVDCDYAWGANMAIRRAALLRVGPFDETIRDGGDEQEWQERLRAQEPGARVRYVAAAGVEHRRVGTDARLPALCRASLVRGRAARSFDARRGRAPGLGSELRTLAGCFGHVLRRRCPAGLTMVAHSLGRTGQCLRERRGPANEPPAGPSEDFLSGRSGTVGGLTRIRRVAEDEALNALELAAGRRLRLARAARLEPPPRRVLAIGVVRPERSVLARTIAAELAGSRHEVELHTCPAGEEGRFENLNGLLARHPAAGHDWLLVIDDDVELPRGFLDRFLFLCERFALDLAQPAHRLDSHAAWNVTRRRPGSVVRETSFVEIGPVTAFAQRTFAALLPFPDLRMGWGLDAHWAALARSHRWRCGITDAVSIRHRAAPAGAGYPREAAVAEARSFLSGRAYMTAGELERTLATHRRW